MGSWQLLFFLCVILIHCDLITAQIKAPNFIHCDGVKSTRSSLFPVNVNLLLSSLSSATPNKKFYNTTIGQNPPDRVYGLYLCRGDVTPETCKNCVENASKVIIQRCPTQTELFVGYDECMLRYANRSIFSIMRNYPTTCMKNDNNISNPEQFNKILNELMDRLVPIAAYGPNDKFETGEAVIADFKKIYGLVQCTPDLTGLDCEKCLIVAMGQIPNCSDGKQGGRVVEPSCNLRYEIDPFYESSPPLASPQLSSPPPPTITYFPSKIAIIVAAAIVVVLFCVVTIVVKLSGKKKTKNTKSTEMCLEDLAPKSYTYKEIKKMTENLAAKLGEGGYGTVYEGEIDNCKVAVKVLKEKGGDFKNEIETIGRTSHVNIVTLRGYCDEKSHRALIYEYMPKGSLDNFIFSEKSLMRDCENLGWALLYDIAVGIARGLEYLHNGCNNQILHFDIKPHNILLDKDFHPKISDFGLSKLCPGGKSAVSMKCARGTGHYIAPEVSKGKASRKSDVYSYGMMVLEMVAGRKIHNELEAEARETYISNWIKKLLKQPRDHNLPEVRTEEDEKFVRKMSIVGFRCIEEDPSNRPEMRKVLEMLAGELEALQIPPVHPI